MQYENALRALFPGTLANTLIARTTYPSASPKTGLASGFSSDSDNGTVSTQDEILLEDGSELMATAFLSDASALLPQLCTSLAPGFTGCCIVGGVRGGSRHVLLEPLGKPRDPVEIEDVAQADGAVFLEALTLKVRCLPVDHAL